MSNETTTTVAGNLTADPELRQTSAGVAVATFTVASTARVQDAATGEWRDGVTLFLRCSVWRRTAQNVARYLTKGDRVVVTGRLRQSNFETDDGQRRLSIELSADEVALSLRSANVARLSKETGETDESSRSLPDDRKAYA